MPSPELQLKISKNEFTKLLFKNKMSLHLFTKQIPLSRNTIDRMLGGLPVSWNTGEVVSKRLKIDIVKLFKPYVKEDK